MRANRAYRLIVKRSGWLPAVLADPARVDHIELVDIADGEVLLFWDAPAQRAARLVRALRADLAQLEASEFYERWVAREPTPDPPGSAGKHDWSGFDASA